MRDGGDIDDVGIGQLGLDIADSRLGHTLLLAGSMVFGVFLQISQLSRFSDGLTDLRALGLEGFQFVFQGASALDGHRKFSHALIPAWRSCKRRTVFSGPNLSASQIA
ncbi:hypothetical protein D9M73_190360 [compost metagenome]